MVTSRCLSSFLWKGEIIKSGDIITLTRDELSLLMNAGLVAYQGEMEAATVTPVENAAAPRPQRRHR